MLAFRIFERMEIDVVEVDHGEALGLAERTGLTAYDAATCGSRAELARSW